MSVCFGCLKPLQTAMSLCVCVLHLMISPLCSVSNKAKLEEASVPLTGLCLLCFVSVQRTQSVNKTRLFVVVFPSIAGFD